MNRIGKKIVPLVLVFIMIIGNLITGLNFVRAQENENHPNVIQNIDYEFDMRW